MKRLVSVFLVFVMFFTLLPINYLSAEEEESADTTDTSETFNVDEEEIETIFDENSQDNEINDINNLEKDQNDQELLLFETENQQSLTEQNSSNNGYAYAVLTNTNTLVFFRSNEIYSNESEGTFSDVYNNKYTGTIFSDFEDGGSGSPWARNSNYIYSDYIHTVKVADGHVISPVSTDGWFDSCKNLRRFNKTGFDFSRTKYMNDMFSFCESLIDIDLRNINTSNVTAINGIFAGCSELLSVDLSGIDTSNIEYMSWMFWGCSKLPEIDLSGFNTSSLTNAMGMFFNCKSLTELDLSSFNTSNVVDFGGMFSGCENLKHLNLSSFSTESATKMTAMFSDCSNLESVTFGEKWTKWLDESYLPEGTWTNGIVNKNETEIYDSFKNNTLSIAGTWYKADKIPENGFAYAVLLDNGDLVFTRSNNIYMNRSVGSIVDTKNNTYSGTIYSEIETLDFNPLLGTRELPWVNDKQKIKNIYVSDDQTIRPISTASWFDSCFNLISFDGTGFDTSNIKNMSSMFDSCIKLQSVELNGFDTSNVENMSGMFSRCASLTTLDLSSFDTSSVERMTSMFFDMSKLTSVTFGEGWNKWIDDSYLPKGMWNKGAISKTEGELFNDYQSAPTNWYGTWQRELDVPENGYAYAILMDDGDLIFTRSFNYYENETYGYLTNENRIYGSGTIFSDVENTALKGEKPIPWENYKKQMKNVYVDDDFVIKPVSMTLWFRHCNNLESFDGTGFDTSETLNMHTMFQYCSSLKTANLDCFDTSKVISMCGMFMRCLSLENLDLSSFNTSNVTNMDWMFYCCESLTELDLSNFNTSNVTDMSYMFGECDSLVSLDLSSFNTSNVTDMGDMFNVCNSLKYLNLDSFDTSNVTNMSCMFGCGRLETIVLGSKWLNNNVEFFPSGTWTNKEIGISKTETELVSEYPLHAEEWSGTWTRELSRAGKAYAVLQDDGDLVFFRSFMTYDNAEQRDQSTTGFTDFYNNIYYGTVFNVIEDSTIGQYQEIPWQSYKESIKSVYVADNQIIAPVDMSNWFTNCEILESFCGTGFDTSKVVNMSGMFENCYSLKSIDISCFDTSSVTDMSYMFSNTRLSSIDLKNFNTSNVTEMCWMFSSIPNLKSINLSSFDTSKVRDMTEMFGGCESLETINLSSFYTSSVTNVSAMFSGCRSLKSLDIRNFNTTNVIWMGNIFAYLDNLETIVLSSNWNKWLEYDYLPEGKWVNTKLGLQKTHIELYDEYPSHASEWAGTWTKNTVPVESIELDESSINMSTNDTKTINATALPENATFKNIIWSSEDETIASVDQNGVITTHKPGKTIITATALDDTYTVYSQCEVRVLDSYYSWLCDFEYSTNNYDGTITLTKHIGTKKDLSINNSIVLDDKHYQVCLGEQLFYNNTTIENLDISGAKFPSYSSYMFGSDDDVKSAFKTISLYYVDTADVSNMQSMFMNCDSLTTLRLHNFNTSNVLYMDRMFYGCKKLESINLSNFNTAKVIGMSGMFSGCESVETINLNTFNTSNVEDMSIMFRDCKKLKYLDLNHFDTYKVVSMDGMFENCFELKELFIYYFNTYNVQDMSYMFSNCRSLQSLNVSNFYTSKVERMNNMFENCKELKYLNVSGFDTSKVRNMHSMFAGCGNLQSLDVRYFNTYYVEDMSRLFYDCYSLSYLDLSNFETSVVKNMYDMFANCSSLTQVKLGKYFIRWIDNAYLPGGTWTNNNLSMSHIDLYNYYPNNSFDSLGLWVRKPNIISMEIDEVILFEGAGEIQANSFDEYGNPVNSVFIYDYYGIENITLNTTKGKISGRTWEVRDKYRELFGYEPQYYDCFYEIQYELGGLKLGTYNVPYYFDGVKGSFNVNIVQNCVRSISAEPRIIVYGDAHLSSEDGEEYYYYSYEPEIISVVLTDGQSFSGKLHETMEQIHQYLNNKFDGYVNCDYVIRSNQGKNNKWGIGTHEATIRICGKTATYNVVIIENPIEEISVEPLKLFKGATKTYYEYKYNEEQNDYVKHYYQLYDVTPRTMNVRVFGEEYSGNPEMTREWLTDVFRKNNLELSGHYYDYQEGGQSHVETWDIGTHEAEIDYLGFKIKFDVEIIDNPLSQLQANNITTSVDNHCINHDIYGNEYRFYEEYYITPGNIKVVFDNKTYSASLRELENIIEEKYNTNVSYEILTNQSAENQWGLGDNNATLRFAGLETDYVVTLTSGVANKADYVRFSYNGDPNRMQPGSKLYLSCDTPYSSIWYSFNYSDEYHLYEDAIVLEPQNSGDETLVVSAYATAEDYEEGDIQSVTYYFIDESVDYGEIIDDDIDYYVDNQEKCQNLWISDIEDFEYTGKAITPDIRLYDNKKLLVKGIDYSVSYKNNIKTGVATVTVTGKGNFTGTLTKNFNIVKKQIELNQIPNVTLIYNTKEQAVAVPRVAFGETVLKNKTDFVYTITDDQNKVYTKVKDKGIYHVTISPVETSNYSFANYTYDVSVEDQSSYKMSSAKINGFTSKYDFTGDPLKQNLTLIYNKVELVEGQDYELSYYNNINPGTATLVIKGINDYYGTVTKTYKINKLPFNSKTIDVIGLNQSYQYDEIIEPNVIIQDKNEKILIEGQDYVVAYKNNTKAGKATVTFTGINNYSGSLSKTFVISPLLISDMEVSDLGDIYYSKGGSKPLVLITNGESKLVLNKDYTISYKNNTKPGIATIVIKGKGNYTGTVSKEFNILATYLFITKVDVADKVFTNKKNNFVNTVTLTDVDGKKLVSGKDYEKTFTYYYSYDTIVNGKLRKAGTKIADGEIIPVNTFVDVVIEGKGYYRDRAYGRYRIIEANISKATVKIPDQYYYGKEVTLYKSQIEVKIGKEKLNLSDFDILSYSNNTNKGTAKVTIQGKGKYGGTKTVTFKIKQKSFGNIIHFNLEGGTGTLSDQFIYKDTKLSNYKGKKVVDGVNKTLAGWSLSKGGPVKYRNNQLFEYEPNNAGSTIELFAVWE